MAIILNLQRNANLKSIGLSLTPKSGLSSLDRLDSCVQPSSSRETSVPGAVRPEDTARHQRALSRPPAMLGREAAAAYVGVSVAVFDDEVRCGMWPKPIMRGARGTKATWSVAALDQCIESLAKHNEPFQQPLPSKAIATPISEQQEGALARLRAVHRD